MRQTSRIITIPKPCHKDLDAMTPVQQGRHCAACQKTVVDFTMMTDGQVLDVFKHAKNNPPCGSFLNSQLDRPLIDNRYQPSFASQVMKRAAAILLLLPATTSALWAQQVKKQHKTTQQASKSKLAAKQAKQIKGRVLDADTHTAVAGVTVEILTLGLTAVTDSTGSFLFTLPDHSTAASIVFSGKKGNREIIALAIDPKNNDEQTLYLKSAAAVRSVTPKEIRTMGVTQTTDIVALSPGIYQRKRGTMAGEDTHKPGGYLVEDVPVQAASIIDSYQPQPVKPTFWQRITKPFRKKHKDNETH